MKRGLAELEARVAALDQLAHRERTVEYAAEEAAKRRFLLLDLEAAGVLDPGQQLPEDLPLLHGYQTAATELGDYLVSDTRQRFNPDAGPTPIVGAPVSLDWFRFPSPGPTHLTPLEWVAFGEYMLSRASAQGGQGEIFTQVGPTWWTLHWRRDDGLHPALVWARGL